MKIKLKTSEGLVDTIIEIVDGVMIVSPKKEKFEPKDGDVFCVDSLCPFVGIVKEEYSYGKPDKDRLYFSVGYWKQSGDMQLGTFCACNRNTEPNYRPATEEEKAQLFQAIKDNGYKWNAETKTLEKLNVPIFKVGDKIRYKRGNRVKRRIVKINNREEFYYTDDGGRVYFMHQDDWELVPTQIRHYYFGTF